MRRYRKAILMTNLMENWIGRAGRGGQGWLTYSFSPRIQLQLEFRLQGLSKDFIGGGRLVDYSASGNFVLSPQTSFSGMLHDDQWRFPVLFTTGQSNLTRSLTPTWWPDWRIH